MRAIDYKNGIIKRESTRNDLMQKMEKVFDYIDDHLHSEIEISELAGIACISEYHFIRVFTLFCNCTPYQYIIKKRIEKAKILIQNNLYTVCEISKACGYGRVQTFRKCFKRETGLTPREYCRNFLAIA